MKALPKALVKPLRDFKELKTLGLIAIGAVALTVGSLGWGGQDLLTPITPERAGDVWIVKTPKGNTYQFSTFADAQDFSQDLFRANSPSDPSTLATQHSGRPQPPTTPSPSTSTAIPASTASTDGSTPPPNKSFDSNPLPLNNKLAEGEKQYKGDPCPIGATISKGGMYSCKTTATILDIGNAAVMVGQAAGGMAVQNMANSEYNNIASQQAMGQPVNQSDIIKSGAKQQRNAANIQRIKGMSTLAIAAVETGLALKHRANAKKATDETDTPDDWVPDNPQMPMGPVTGAKTTSRMISDLAPGATIGAQITATGQEVSEEQKNMAKKALGQAIMHGITGAADLAAANMAKKGAEQMDEAAQQLAGMEGQGAPGFEIPEPGPAPSMNADIGPGMPTFPGVGGDYAGNGSNFGQFGPAAGEPEVSAGQSEPEGSTEVPTLGPPVGAGNPNDPNVANKEVAFKTPEAGGTGGGNAYTAGSPGGGDARERGETAEAQAQMANNIAQAGQGSSGRGGARGGSGDGGTDLSKLFASLLNQKPEDDKERKSILELGRKPASAEEDGSLLGQDTDLFKRISQAYAEKQKRGFVGI